MNFRICKASAHVINEKMRQVRPDRRGDPMKLSVCTLVLVLLGIWSSAPVLAAEKKTRQATTQSKPKAKPKTPVRKASPSPASSKQSCQTRKVKTNKGVRTQRVCNTESAAALQSPIKDNALEKSPADNREGEIKARTAPDRAYAVDGSSFFYQGRKYRVEGLTDEDGSDMAKQRLQKSLESGNLMIDPKSTDEHGVSSATVRINGRDIVEQLR